MLYHNVLLSLLSITASTSASPIGYRFRREVPQEHSHNSIVDAVRTSLNLNNPAKIQDPIFALLGNAAAAAGAGSITDTDCLQQAVADQAFTNAKAAGDVNGMVNALIFRALERNTASVGATSAKCTSLKAVNPEIAVISQHQDPASAGAAANNKAVVLALAQQIHAVGGDPQDALKSGTFAPGKIGDPTAAGNTCDDANDEPGCIFSKNLLVDDATADEINAAVGGASSGSSASKSAAATTAAKAAATTSAAAAASTAASTNNAAAASGNVGDFGSCSVPQIEFATGFDNRKETSFQPVDKTSYNHGSAQNIDIITQFMCDTLTNTCGADQTAKNTCATAQKAADAATKGTGAQADAFNAVFGIKTAFADVAEVNNQGVTVAAGAGAATATTVSVSTAAAAAATTAAVATTAAATAAAASTTAAAGNNASTSSSAVGNFGSCSVPQIKFAVGLDGRKETSFEPADLKSFNHGSAQNIDIISKFICDQLTNSCKADQTAKDTCQTASAAADAQAKGTGAQADAFNAAFGITTTFADVAEVNDQGVTVGAASATAASAATATSGSAATVTSAASTNDAATSGSTSSSSSVGNFGSCSIPQIEFATGFDNRKETSFQPVDKTSYNHGSAQNIDIITKFMCDTLTNTCGADQTAKDTCASASTAADGQTKGTGAQADAFNAVFGIKTAFAAVAEVNDQGVTVAAGVGSGAATATAAATKAATTVSTTAAAASTKAAAASSTSAASSSSAAASGSNLQTFTGTLGGAAPAVTAGGRGFEVEGEGAAESDLNVAAALQRSCSIQHNACADAANSGGAFTVAQCDQQNDQCNAAASK